MTIRLLSALTVILGAGALAQASIPAPGALGVPRNPLSSGADGASADDEAPAEPSDDEGHRRMKDELARVRLQNRLENSYLGDGELLECQERLDHPEGEHPMDIAILHHAVGVLHLRSNRIDQAIQELTTGRTLLDELGGVAYPKLWTRMTYQLGLAHLRRGETSNCVLHHTQTSCIFPIDEGGVHQDPAGSTAAATCFLDILERDISRKPALLCARWLLNIAYMTLGKYPEGVPEAHLIAPELFATKREFPRFEDVAHSKGVDTFNLCGGSLAEDFDGDGDIDLFNSTWDAEGPLQFFAGDGRGGFTDRSKETGLEGITGGLNLVPGDYDGDGLVDVLVLRGAWLKQNAGRQPNSLLHNEGGGRFIDVTFRAGLGEVHYPTQTAGWADYDGDGDLDLYIGNEAARKNRHPSQLFRNNGDGTFSDVAEQAGVTNLRYAKGVAWGDYDADGFPDLFVSNYGDANRLYHNQGDGTFTDVASSAGVELPSDSFPCWFWDFDNDGNLDLFVSSYDQGGEEYRLMPVVADALGLPHKAETDYLYRGDGQGHFVESGQALGLTRITLTMGANFGDLDNDGFLDFYLGTGYPEYDGLVPNVMFHNEAGTGFSDVTTAGGFGHLQKGHGISFADLDGDGDQDVFQQMGGAFPGDAFANALYENPGFGNHWIKLRLRGERSNSLGLGARLRLDLIEGDRERSVYREVSSGGSFGGNPFEQHLGMGSAQSAKRLEVFWPTSGVRQVFEDVAGDRSYVVREGAMELEPVE